MIGLVYYSCNLLLSNFYSSNLFVSFVYSFNTPEISGPVAPMGVSAAHNFSLACSGRAGRIGRARKLIR